MMYCGGRYWKIASMVMMLNPSQTAATLQDMLLQIPERKKDLLFQASEMRFSIYVKEIFCIS